MTDSNSTPINEDLDEFKVQDVPQKDRLTSLKEKAKLMGIKFSPNIGEAKLLKMIEDHENADKPQAQDNTPAQDLSDDDSDADNEKQDAPAPVRQLTRDEIRANKRREALKLVRVMVVPMDPLRAQQEGEMVTSGNSLIGSISKYVPYNAEAGYHIPQILLNVMRERTYTHHYTVKDSKGNEINRQKQMPAYNIAVLPDLTEQELAALARDQRARAGRSDHEEV